MASLDLNLYLPSMSSYFAVRFDLKCYLYYLSISPYYRFQLLLFFSFFLLYLLMLFPSLVFTYYIYSVSLDVNRIYLACSSAMWHATFFQLSHWSVLFSHPIALHCMNWYLLCLRQLIISSSVLLFSLNNDRAMSFSFTWGAKDQWVDRHYDQMTLLPNVWVRYIIFLMRIKGNQAT